MHGQPVIKTVLRRFAGVLFGYPLYRHIPEINFRYRKTVFLKNVVKEEGVEPRVTWHRFWLIPWQAGLTL